MNGTEWSWCKCGNPKAPAAEECLSCYRARIADGLGDPVIPVSVERATGDPVRDAFEWIIGRCKGKVS